MREFSLQIRKATSMVAFLILGLSFTAIGKTETYSDLIEKSYNLSLQKDRPQAVRILAAVAKKESKKGKIPKELIEALTEISQTFYSEKAQQLYETALSLRQADPATALSKLKEANTYDSENLLISLEIARNQVVRNECQNAFESIKKIKDIYSFHELVDLLLAQTAICSNKLNEFGAIKLSEYKRSEYAVHWYLVLAEYQYRKNEFQQVKNTLNEAIKSDSQNPQIYYWLWKVSMDTKEPSQKNAQKYISECKKLTSRKIRKYLVDPFLCHYVTEVENYLKKNNNS